MTVALTRTAVTKIALTAITVSLLTAACAGSSDPPDNATRLASEPGAAGEPGEEGANSDSEADTGLEPDSDSGPSSEPDSGSDSDSETETDGGGEAMIDPGDAENGLTAGLSTFDDCGSLLDHLRTEYAERVGPWGFEYGGWRESWRTKSVTADEDTADGSDPGSAEATSDYRFIEVVDSGPDLPEAGVDGADLVKTDGRRIFAVSNGLLLVVDADSRQIKGSTRLASGQGTGLLLDGDDLLVILSDRSLPVRAALEPDDGSDAADQLEKNDLSVIVVQRVRVDGYEPRVVETLRMDGTYSSIFSVNGVAWVVSHHDPPMSFPPLNPQGGTNWEAEQANRAAVLDSTLEDWLPSYAVSGGTGTSAPSEGGLLPSCENVYVPSEFAGFGVITVMSLPVSGPLAGNSAVSVTVSGSSVHATPQSLYVAPLAWVPPEIFADEVAWTRVAENRQDVIHRFDLTDPARAAYAASGRVPGRIRDYLLSEHDGHLRVVTTTGDLWWQQSLSQVRVLRQDGNRLVEVGAVGDIGRGERIESVRFAGDIGYVVPYRQADPLYTLDLSDPENPAIGGPFEIPGFSNYLLHHIGDDLVLGVGNDTYESTEAVTRSKISLFDVSNLAGPRELAVWTAPGPWAYAIGDYLGPELARIFVISSWTNGTAEAVALRIEGDSITEIGWIDHIDPSDHIDSNIGSTDCRKLSWSTAEEAEPESELWHTLFYTDTIACEPGESPAMVGFDCWPVDWVQEDARSLGVIVGDEMLFSCQFGRVNTIIVRSLVIGGELWTLSYRHGDTWEYRVGRLAASDLATLERVTLINLF